MNYFELYELPISFNPDAQLVKQKFYELSKKYHPDFYVNESEDKQAEVLAMATLNNKAYQVFTNPQKLLHYILTLNNYLIEGENYALPPAFLMEMMEVNEALMELELVPNTQKLNSLKEEIAALSQKLFNELASLTLAFNNLTVSQQEASLKAIKDIYYRNIYLYRLKETINRLN